jgi:hypothetical protein
MPLWPFLVLNLLGQIVPPAYTETMFQAALKNDSTAPDYVLITVQDTKTKTSRVICVTANFLEGAIIREYGLSYSDGNMLKAKKIILSRKDRVFTFTKPEAAKNIPIYYSEAQLKEVRNILRSKTNKELMNGFNLEQLRDDLAARQPGSSEAYRDAIAHVLLERGILCGMGDVSDATYVETPQTVHK